VRDVARFAIDLAGFLQALYAIDPAGGPAAGAHSFNRGGPLTAWNADVEWAITTLAAKLDAEAVMAVWEAALATEWERPPAWVHGDVASSNLLVSDGRLSAVLDFGCSAVGDPACDLAIAWTYFHGESRQAFRDALPLDDGTWARGRGWALWKALITCTEPLWSGADADDAARQFGWRLTPRGVLDEVLQSR
jgi:aminoglycoside phosphotransferase (APT) family kinase protein